MNKQEIEKQILDEIRELVNRYDEIDKQRKEMVAREISYGTDPSVFSDLFYFNHYIFTDELRNIISQALFNHNETEHIERNRYHGPIDRFIANEDEVAKINKVSEGMVKAGLIKFSKTQTMVKVLFA